MKIAGELDTVVKATVRVVPGIKAGGHNFIQTGHVDTKFGFSSHYGIYLKAIKKILDSKNMEFEGLHAHIGSQVFDLYAYISAMRTFMGFVDEIYKTFGVVVKKINAGGGYGIAYNKLDHPLDFETITEEIMNVISEAYEKRGWERPMVLIEPGRWVVGNAGITLYTVGAIKVVTIAGKCCESGDLICKDLHVTGNIEAGDIFAVFSTGAYNYTMSSNYNQLPKPAVVFTYKGKSKVVIRRQTFDDLVEYDEDQAYE